VLEVEPMRVKEERVSEDTRIVVDPRHLTRDEATAAR
jgi:hypothetical protein